MKYENKINIDTKDNKKIKSKLIEYFKVNQNRTYNFNYLSKLFGFNDDEENVFKTMLKELELEGKILIKDDEITYFKKNDRLKIGKIKFNSDNKPYVTYNNSEKSKIYIENLNGAINGDIVLIETEENTTKKIGNVLKIINRLNDEIILDCIIDEKNNYTLVPKDKSFIYDIELDYLDTKTLVDGSRIKIKLHDFKNGKYYASVSSSVLSSYSPLSTAFANSKSSSTVVIEVLLLCSFSSANAVIGTSAITRHNASRRLRSFFFIFIPPK